MRSSTIIGLAIGAVLGAFVVDMYPPAQDIMNQTKTKVKKAVDNMKGQAK